MPLTLEFDLGLEPIGALAGTAWWRDPLIASTVVEAIERAGMWLGFGSRDDVVRAVAAGDEAVHDLTGGDSSLRFTVDRDDLRVQLWLAPDEVAARRATLVESLCGLATDLRERLAGRIWIHSGAAVAGGIAVPRVRPLRMHRSINDGALLDVVDRDFYAGLIARAPDDGWQRELDRLLSAPLPAGARRDQRGPLVMLRWIDDLSDPSAVVEAVVAQARWLARHLGSPLAPGWTAAGDRLEVPPEVTPRAPLTFYSARHRRGYQALFALPDGTVDEDTLAAAARWRRGGLPDGAALDRLAVIVPKRDAAIALRPRAVALGIDQVLYVDKQGRWWDPFPPGPWVEE